MSPPEPTRPTPGPPEPRRISDSPLFWFFVFGTMGLLALVAIAPKHAQRQERLERMADSRQRPFAEGAADPSEVDELPPVEPPPVDADAFPGMTHSQDETPQPGELPASRSMLPLMMFLAAVLAIAAVAVGTARYLRLAEARSEGRNRARPSSKEQP